MLRGVYVGKHKHLVGHTALLREIEHPSLIYNGNDHWIAQFDSEETWPLNFGWRAFEYDDFDVIPDDIEDDFGECDKCLPFIEKMMQWYLSFWFVGLAVVGFAILKACVLAS